MGRQKLEAFRLRDCVMMNDPRLWKKKVTFLVLTVNILNFTYFFLLTYLFFVHQTIKFSNQNYNLMKGEKRIKQKIGMRKCDQDDYRTSLS